MIRMFVRHSVTNFEKWKQAYDAFDAERRDMGVRGDAVFQTAGHPNEVTAWHDFDTILEARAFAASERLRETMENAGVASEPIIWFTYA